jgi:hypothetical protein
MWTSTSNWTSSVPLMWHSITMNSHLTESQ